MKNIIFELLEVFAITILLVFWLAYPPIDSIQSVIMSAAIGYLFGFILTKFMVGSLK